jgi:hypothetical protein
MRRGMINIFPTILRWEFLPCHTPLSTSSKYLRAFPKSTGHRLLSTRNTLLGCRSLKERTY